MTKILPRAISFDWDKGNIDKNLKKHNVTNKEIEEVFNKPLRKIFEDSEHSQKEERFVIIGSTNKKRKLFVSFTIRDQQIRIISARDQSKKERKLNEEK